MSQIPVQPTRSVKIFRSDNDTYIRFIGHTSFEGTRSTTLRVNPDGTVTYTGSTSAPNVNYFFGHTADPKVLKRISTFGTGGTSAVLYINPETDKDNPYVNTEVTSGQTGKYSAQYISAGDILTVTGQQVNVVDKFEVYGMNNADAEIVFNDIKMDIFDPADKDAIVYDAATNSYKPGKVESGPSLVEAAPVPFTYAYSRTGPQSFVMPSDCTRILYITTSTGQSLDPNTDWYIDEATNTFNLTGLLPLGTSRIYGVALKGTLQINPVAEDAFTLQIDFPALNGSMPATEVTRTMTPRTAANYIGISSVNVQELTIVNTSTGSNLYSGNVVSGWSGVSLLLNTEYRFIITPLNDSIPGYVLLEN